MNTITVERLYRTVKDRHITFTGSHDVFMPRKVVENIISCIDIKNKLILVLYNVEFLFSLLYTYNISPKNITFFSDHENKQKFAEKMGVTCITSLERLTMDSRPVLLVNPPYTDGKEYASEIYTTIINTCIDRIDPIAIGGVTPENLLNGGQKKKTLREKILKKYGLKNLCFLNQKIDWDSNISIDTVWWVVEENYSGPITVLGRNKKQEYTITNQLSEYVNGETQDIHDWLLKIQTSSKINLKKAKKGSGVAQQLKISKDSVDSCKVVSGIAYDSHNTEWRVAFGYMRSNTCAIVPPGISIPDKYRYINFGNDESYARKFAAYMLSEPVRFIMKLTYTTRTLDNPQLTYIPNLDLSKFSVIDDTMLYQLWQVNIPTQLEIKNIVANEIPF